MRCLLLSLLLLSRLRNAKEARVPCVPYKVRVPLYVQTARSLERTGCANACLVPSRARTGELLLCISRAVVPSALLKSDATNRDGGIWTRDPPGICRVLYH